MPIAYDIGSNSGRQTPASYNWNHTCTGANLALIVGVMVYTSPDQTITSVTYNGVDMGTSRISIDDVGNFTHCKLFVLAGPATGLNSIAVTNSGTTSPGTVAGAISLTGVDQVTPVEAVGSAGSALTCNTTSLSNNAWLVDLLDVINCTTGAHAANASQNERVNFRDNVNSIGIGISTKLIATPGTNAMSWTDSDAGAGHEMLTLAIKAAVSGTAQPIIYDSVRRIYHEGIY